jgi:hypothetical protein
MDFFRFFSIRRAINSPAKYRPRDTHTNQQVETASPPFGFSPLPLVEGSLFFLTPGSRRVCTVREGKKKL